jgi:hypothetical protein
MSSKKEIEVPTSHPLEAVLNVEEGTTMVPKTIIQGDVEPHQTYDEKDIEIDKQFQEIYDLALTAFEDQTETAEIVDPQYKARTAEVAAAYLTTALNAANSKMALKQQREKLEVSKSRITGGITNNGNMIVTNRNDLLRLMEERDGERDAIEGEFSSDE